MICLSSRSLFLNTRNVPQLYQADISLCSQTKSYITLMTLLRAEMESGECLHFFHHSSNRFFLSWRKSNSVSGSERYPYFTSMLCPSQVEIHHPFHVSCWNRQCCEGRLIGELTYSSIRQEWHFRKCFRGTSRRIKRWTMQLRLTSSGCSWGFPRLALTASSIPNASRLLLRSRWTRRIATMTKGLNVWAFWWACSGHRNIWLCFFCTTETTYENDLQLWRFAGRYIEDQAFPGRCQFC